MSHSGNEPRRHLKLSSSPTVAQIRSSQTLKDSHSSPSSDSNRRRLQEKNSLIPRGPFTVIVSGREFNLSYEQINYDQPNVFTIAFLDQGFNEQTNGTMIFDSRSSEIFQQIVEYLSGYPIFPVSQPRKLLADCEFYGLDGLRDLLSLPKVGDALSSRHAIRRVIRFEDVVSGRAKGVEWSEEGLVETERHALWHAMVFMTGALLKVDLTVRASGECTHAEFGIELPDYAEDASDWTAVMAESLSATPLLLNDGTFDGNFGDLVNWVASFLVQFSPSRDAARYGSSPLLVQHPEMTETLTRIMPGVADNLRLKASQGYTALKLSTSFWASELSFVIAPQLNTPGGLGVTSGLVAKVLNCNLSTGLFRRRALKPIVSAHDL